MSWSFTTSPLAFPLSYRAKSGRRTTQWHTPDFFVLRRESVGWEEWKPAQRLDTLAESSACSLQALQGLDNGAVRQEKRMPNHSDFHIACVPPPSSTHWRFENLKFLQDFWAHEVPPNPEQEGLALAHIQAHPGIPLSELLATYPDLPVRYRLDLACHSSSLHRFERDTPDVL